MQVVVLVAEQDAEPARAGAQALARRAGVVLRPQHPGAGDPALACWLVADVPDASVAHRLVADLRAARGVQAAYVKPEDEPAAPA